MNGYIEGYYGRLLKWSERYMILKKLSECKFNTYFYCPKEDLKHRLNWRENYDSEWNQNFSNFCELGLKLNINVIIGLSPGLDFNYSNNKDLKILCVKAKKLKSLGASGIALMFDDIPPDKNLLNNNINESEGKLHAKVANKLSKHLSERIFCSQSLL